MKRHPIKPVADKLDAVQASFQIAGREMKNTTMVLVLGLLLTGCMTTEYAPLEPSEISSSVSNIRITLNNDLQYVFEAATIDNHTVSGVAYEHGFTSVSRADIKLIEKAEGNQFDTHSALRLTGIVLTLGAIIMVSCAIDKDCTQKDADVSARD